MIVSESTKNVTTGGVQNAVSFGIKQEGLAHIFNVLRNQLYSNKILAVLREYSCNAVDAHVEAGHNRPIRVTLPTRLSPELRIRDFGFGLTETEIQEVYAFYGESTKRKSNALIGQLGLGSKSAFAYGDNFVINSFVNGIKTTYNAYIDPSQIGQIAKLNAEDTTEEDGVEIVIPVSQGDYDNFTHTARELFKYFEVKPEIIGAQIAFDHTPTLLEGDNWKILKGTSRYSWSREDSCVIIMGNIGYKLNKSSLKLNSEIEDEAAISNFLDNVSLELKVNIGDCDIAASRESLQYTPRTIDNIKAQILAIRNEVVDRVTNEFKAATTEWQFRKMLATIFDMTHPYYCVSDSIRSGKAITFNGKQIKDYNVKLAHDKHFRLCEPRMGYMNGHTGRIVKGGNWTDEVHSVNPANTIIVENTKGVTNGLINFMFNYLKDSKNVLLCQFTDAKDKADTIALYGITDADIVDIATLTKLKLPQPLRSSSGGSGNLVDKDKHTSRILKFDKTKASYNPRSSGWNPEDIDLDNLDANKYVYVTLDFFYVSFDGRQSVQNIGSGIHLKQIINMIEEVNKNLTNKITIPTVIGFKVAEFDKIAKTGLRSFKQFIEDEIVRINNSSNNLVMDIEMVSKINNMVQRGAYKSVLTSLSNKDNTPNLTSFANEVIKRMNCAKKGEQILDVMQRLDIKTSAKMTKTATLDDLLEKTNKFCNHFKWLHEIGSYSYSTYRASIMECMEAMDGKMQDLAC